MGKVLLVDTIPKNARCIGSVNLGFEIVKKKMNADSCFWYDKTKVSDYDTIGFNVFYPTHLLNIGPFLRRNGLLEGRKCRLIAGGQGIGKNGILDKVVDEVFIGEYDWEDNKKSITSDIIIKNDKAAIELTRGCKYSCGFCEYSWMHKPYREKNIELAKKQIDEVVNQKVKNINFMSANFAGYSRLDDLMNYCLEKEVRVLNSDSSIFDIKKIFKWSNSISKYYKVGIESFSEETRKSIGKGFTDAYLEEVIKEMIEHGSGLHFYLIYGLIGDDYKKWFEWVRKLRKIIDEYDLKSSKKKNIRIEYSITNFEPSCCTPFANFEGIDFKKKDEFLDKFMDVLLENRFIDKKLTYGTCKGRFGRKELSYKLLLMLKKSGSEITDRLLNALPRGIGRTIKDETCKKFFEYGKEL